MVGVTRSSAQRCSPNKHPISVSPFRVNHLGNPPGAFYSIDMASHVGIKGVRLIYGEELDITWRWWSFDTSGHYSEGESMG
ncbi:hypothetical protein WG66_013489 [Moniliophthora roreri]|nr:hypothetical protein WG66_013489 [Moniliophthora roreri]